MNEGLSRKNPAELHKEVLGHLAEKYDETTDPAERERIATYYSAEQLRAAKITLAAAQRETFPKEFAKKAAEQRETFAKNAEIRRTVDKATLRAVQERLKIVDPKNNSGEARVDQRQFQAGENVGTGTGREDVVTVESPANQAPETGGTPIVEKAVANDLDIKAAQEAQDEREKMAAKILAFRQNPNAPPPDEAEEEPKAASG